MNGRGNVPSCQDAEDIITGRAAADRETVATQAATPVNFLLISGTEAALYKMNRCIWAGNVLTNMFLFFNYYHYFW